MRLKAHCIDLEMMPQQIMQHQGIVTTLTQKMLHHLLNHFLSLKILQQAMWSLIEKHLDKFKKATLQQTLLEIQRHEFEREVSLK